MENPSHTADQQSSVLERGSGRVTKRKSRRGSVGGSSRPRAQKVAVACEQCREKKRKCSGTRPQCDICAKKGQQCLYSQYAFRRGWPSNVVEMLSGKIAELEKAQNSDMRSTGPPSKGWLGSLDSHLQVDDGRFRIPRLHPPFHPPGLVLNDVMNQAQSATKVDDQVCHELGRSSDKDAPVRGSLDIAPSMSGPTSATLIVRNADADISVPTPTATLDADKDESGVDAMGATGGAGTSSMAIGRVPNSGFFGTSSTISFMRKIQDVIRSFSVGATVNVNEGADDNGHRVSTNSSTLNLALIGLPWRTSDHDSECESIDYLVPPRREADALVKKYFENVFLLRPYLNRVAFDKRYMKMWSTDEPDPENGRPAFFSTQRPSRNETERIQFYMTVNLVFALGCRLSPSSSPSERILKSERFFQRTQQPRIVEALNHSSLELVQSLLLMGQYLQSTERSTQCWNVIGFAIRVAQGIGLHLDLPATTNRSQLEVEMRRRVWWGCIALDREISMTFGRPIMVHPIMNCGIRLPSVIDDQLLSNRPVHEVIPSNAQGVTMAFFVYTLKLSNILCDILIMLHCQDCNQDRDSSAPVNEDNSEQYLARPNTQSLLSFDNLLNRWHESLPPYLSITRNWDEPSENGSDSEDALKAMLKRQADILHTQYLHVRILLFRPLLLELFNKEHAPLNESEDSGTLNTILQRTALTSISKICISIAQQQIDHIYTNVTVGGTKIYSWWYIVYYVYTCAIVIMTGRLCPSIQSLSDKEGLSESWDRALKCLESYCVFSQPAQKGFKVLKIVDEQLFKSHNTSRIDGSVNNTSPSIIPTRMEEDQTQRSQNANSLSVGGDTATFLPIHPLGRPGPLQLAGESSRGGYTNQNNIVEAEEPRIDSGMDFDWNQGELQLDWLSSIPFVDEFHDDVFGTYNSNSFL